MHSAFVVFAVLPAVFAAFVPSQQAHLKVHTCDTVSVSTKKLSSDVTLCCRTGQNEDRFEITIAPNAAATVSDFQLNGKDVTSGPVDSDTVITGSMKDDLTVEQTTGNCGQGNREIGCSYAYSGVLTFRQQKVVPGSVSPLFRTGRMSVSVQCMLAPENPESDDTVNNVNSVPLSECESFNHTLTISPAVRLDSSVVSVSFTSPIARSGYGYKLTKCMLSLPGTAPAVPLLLNGKTQKNNRFEVTGRSTDGGAGEAYQLNLNGIAISEVLGGNLECEVERCRSAVVGSRNVAQCLRGTLMSDFIAVSGRASVPVVSPIATVPLSGSVKLYIAQSSAARSSASQVIECVGLPSAARFA